MLSPKHDHAVECELSAKGVFDAGPTSDLHGHITCESMGHWRVLQIRFRGIELSKKRPTPTQPKHFEGYQNTMKSEPQPYGDLSLYTIEPEPQFIS